MRSVQGEMENFHAPHRSRRPAGLRDRVLAALVPKGMAVRLSRPVTRAAAPIQRRKARRIHDGPTKVHLGCGPNYLDQWINVDLLGWRVDLAWDLTSPLPFLERSVDVVFTEHVIEHLRYEDGAQLISEACRVLRPGGIIRIVVPDAGRYMRSYATGDGWLSDLRPDAATPLLGVADVLYRHGHVSAWDASTLIALLEEVGFEQANVSSFGVSSIEPCPDLKSRAPESLYVEAVR